MTYYYLKTLHLLFVLIWISGLMYTSGLFLLAGKLSGDGNNKTRQMAMNFWHYATWPSMIIGMFTGMAMLHLRLFHLADVWMQVKLLGVIILVAFHIKCHLLYKRTRKSSNQDAVKSPKSWGRLVAIGATFGVFFLFLMGLKDSFQWVYGTIIATLATALVGFWLAKKT
jgi:putative membrane protein